jgi:phenylalanyl-tRNA synthetase beta chain
MKISYNWIHDYLPEEITRSKMIESPREMARILTSVGLEVEDMHSTTELQAKLDGLITGVIITCVKHPNADKLKIATVDNGHGETLHIVCGAPNVATGQKVIVAPAGTTIYPTNGEPFTIKKATIRGVESNGMLCAEDEIGLGTGHEGIIVLPDSTKPGLDLADYLKTTADTVIEIGLTPNRMDAMSHLGVAKDLCAYLSYHSQQSISPISPFSAHFKADNTTRSIEISIENTEACSRYAGVSIAGITIAPSPEWLQTRLKSIGVRPINNIVDITNFILHETGQPLHAFDADKIKGNGIIVKTLPEGTPFVTLDDKERRLHSEDLMICNRYEEPMCIGGVFGGRDSGVDNATTNIFLESAWFNPIYVRRTSLRHNLRTDAATRFEKGVNIGNTTKVLKRAALLIKEICGGLIASEIIDIYPVPKVPKEVTLHNEYLQKLSGKIYSRESVKEILGSLNFSLIEEDATKVKVAVPFSNPDISIPADIVEEIMRIDGLDSIAIPAAITIAPSTGRRNEGAPVMEKIAGWLTGNGFSEIFTNSITNSKYFSAATLQSTVKIINGLSEDLDVLRPSMLPTGLETVSYNLNRKNTDLLLFEFGRTYASVTPGIYTESENLALYFTGNKRDGGWKTTSDKADIYFVKGICAGIFALAGITDYRMSPGVHDHLDECITALSKDSTLAIAGNVKKVILDKFSIRHLVWYLQIHWAPLLSARPAGDLAFTEIPKFPQVSRDLSIIINKSVAYQALEDSILSLHLARLISYRLFDVFENEKMGADKKSLAISFTFSDREKTLTDSETDEMMARIIHVLVNDRGAEIRST